MESKYKDESAILKKIGIKELNPMQIEAHKEISSKSEVVLLSNTGTGKTLAFLLPLIKLLDTDLNEIQLLIIVPSRELAIQIQQVIRDMGSGFKTNVVYGGRSGSKDRIEIKHPPTILVGTAGRVADHIRQGVVETKYIRYLVLDEFDKSLEIGFEEEMKDIIYSLNSLIKKVLTSATQKIKIPSFLGMKNPKRLNFLSKDALDIEFKLIECASENKLESLLKLLLHIGNKNGIIFCNLKSSIQDISNYLHENNIAHANFHGDLEQRDRERSLIKFRNGTHRLMLASDLAARGLDIPELDFIIHYQLPMRTDEFVHRNGRTGRMNSKGVAYILKWREEDLPEFIRDTSDVELSPSVEKLTQNWVTLYISGGRRDKISKGDIAGLFFKQGKLNKDELGIIEIQQDCAFVAVPPSKSNEVIGLLNNSKLKKKKVRISLLA